MRTRIKQMLAGAVLLAAACVFLPAAQPAVAPAARECKPPHQAFMPGEKLQYTVSYHWGLVWMGAGEAVFKVDTATLSGKKYFHFVGLGVTYSSYNWFYDVKDRYESYVDAATMQPYRFIRDVNESGYHLKEDVYFNHQTHKAVSTKSTKDIPECLLDVVTAIYYSRGIDYSKYQPNDIIPLTIYLDDEVYPIYIRYMGKEKLKTALGTFNCIKFKPLLISGTIFTGGEKMTVWASDDQNRLPLRVESEIVVGAVQVDLYKFTNIRYPLTSKIK